MAYEINLFNGTYLVSVDDQTINTTATDLKLVGRNYAGYGEIQNENYVWLLENFANTAPPSHPITGQLWFDATNKKIKVYDGNKFKSSSSAEVSAVQPTNLSAGDFWFNTTEQQLFTWSGAEFILIGPAKTPQFGETSAAPATIKDAVGSSHEILKFQAGAEVIAIVSKDAFIINNIINPITGFNQLQKGINFVNSSATGVTSSEHRFWGTAANADRLGGLVAADYLRASNTIFATQVSFKDSGFTVGDQNDLKIHVKNGLETIIENTLGNDIIIRLTSSPEDVRDVMFIERTGVTPGLDEFYNLGSAGAKWKEVRGKDMYATSFHGNLIGNISSPDIQTPITFNNNTVINADLTVNQHLINVGKVTLNPPQPSTMNNIDIGNLVRKTAKFTLLDANDTAIFTKNVPSLNPVTGTVIVTGGVGVSGSINAGGNGSFAGTGSLKVPVGTTAQRPTGVTGMIRYNTDIGNFEGFDGQEWKLLGGTQDEDWGLVTGTLDAYNDLGGLF